MPQHLGKPLINIKDVLWRYSRLPRSAGIWLEISYITEGHWGGLLALYDSLPVKIFCFDQLISDQHIFVVKYIGQNCTRTIAKGRLEYLKASRMIFSYIWFFELSQGSVSGWDLNSEGYWWLALVIANVKITFGTLAFRCSTNFFKALIPRNFRDYSWDVKHRGRFVQGIAVHMQGATSICIVRTRLRIGWW
jgi:hypothetical protein